MKRPSAVLLVVAMMAGCRSSQPTTNPFMRTTVAPPVTSPGVIVTPGQPMAQGIAPPLVTSPAPPPVNMTPAPVVPVTPVPVAAPMAAPATGLQNGSRFHPPGGDYLFHQSSHESPAAKAESGQVQLASANSQSYTVVTACYAPPSDTAPADEAPTESRPTEPRPRLEAQVQPDGMIINPYVKQKPSLMQADGTVINPYVKQKTAAAPAALPAAPAQPLPQAARKTFAPAPAKIAKPIAKPPARLKVEVKTPEPPADLSAFSVGSTTQQTSTLRILGESVTSTFAHKQPSATRQPAGAKPQSPVTSPVLRITAGAAQPALRSTVQAELPKSGTGLAIKSADIARNSASLMPPASEPAVVRASFEPVVGSASSGTFSHAADYQTLRGKLEYSASLKQWKLRYIPIDGRTDRYGGSVILPDSPDLAGFKPGDLVEVRGAMPATRISSSGFAPQYAPTSIQRQSH